MKKILSISLLFIIILNNFLLCSAYEPKDYFDRVVSTLEEEEIIKGDHTGDLMLNEPITREQIAVILGRVIDITHPDSEDSYYIFKDHKKIANWAKDFVAAGIENQYINGYPDGTFKPQNNVLYEEAVKLILCAGAGIAEPTKHDPGEYIMATYDYPYEILSYAYDKGYLWEVFGEKGKPIQRLSAFTMIYNIFYAENPPSHSGNKNYTFNDNYSNNTTSSENKMDFNGDGISETIKKNYSSDDWQGTMFIKDGATGKVLKEVDFMTKTKEWQIVWSNFYKTPYLLTVTSLSDAHDLTSVYEYKEGSFVKVDAWGIYTNKDSLPYTKLFRCGIKDDSYGYDKNKGANHSEAYYNAYIGRYKFEVLFTSKKY